MQIFRVVFIHDDNDYDLGLHASILSAQQRIEAAKKLPGFCDIPSNALILPYSLIGSQTEPGVVYDTSVYCHDEWFDYEYTYHLGIFGNCQDAEAAIEMFQRNNASAKNADFEIEPYSIRRKLGDFEWCNEGFTKAQLSFCAIEAITTTPKPDSTISKAVIMTRKSVGL